MRLLGILLLLPACFVQDEDLANFRRAIDRTRGRKSYHVKYRAVIKAPNSDPMIIEGRSVWVSPGVLYVDYKASGGDEKRIIRVGDGVWIYHDFVEDWVTAEEMGNQGAGRGVQNPDEILGVIRRHAQNVKLSGKQKVGDVAADAFELTMTGPEIENIMREQSAQGEFDWKQSKAMGKVLVNPDDGLIYEFSSDIKLKSTDPQIRGFIKYDAEVKVVDYGKVNSIAFKILDAEGGEKVIEIPEHIRADIRKLKKSASGD